MTIEKLNCKEKEQIFGGENKVILDGVEVIHVDRYPMFQDLDELLSKQKQCGFKVHAQWSKAV